jgi:hypothetical protein
MKALYVAASFGFLALLLGGCGAGVMPTARSVAAQPAHRHALRPMACPTPTDSGGIMTGGC